LNPGSPAVYTVGHSTQTLESFVALLRRHQVSAVADVRSAPYSRFAPQFNHKALSAELPARDIAYVFLGRELGARSEDPACFENGQVRFDRLAATALFMEGIERVLRGAGDYTIALLCAEKDPINCHRAILVGRKLSELGVAVRHILADGTLETQTALEDRLLVLCSLPPAGDMFKSREDYVAQAYAMQGGRIAWHKPESGSRSI
jgi:uncharacterized protein (DUF488 family)